ncbi:MAG: hypothetical protein HOC20_05870 [Chloroflexi bacterium]|jgi:hypothetical protein|nr:hypothetical protein [Chloroflexota bacterium]
MRTAHHNCRVLAALFIVCIFPFTGCDRQQLEERQVNVVFRFDDYSATSSTEMELKIIDAFRNNETPITFGVIPFICAGDPHDPIPTGTVPLTARKGSILKTGVEDGILDVALHGSLTRRPMVSNIWNSPVLIAAFR